MISDQGVTRIRKQISEGIRHVYALQIFNRSVVDITYPNVRYRQSTLTVSCCVTLEKKIDCNQKSVVFILGIIAYVFICLYARVDDIVIKYIYPLREEKNKGLCRSRCGRLVG